jgi:DNA-binding NarL/FixJ family response regulator
MELAKLIFDWKKLRILVADGDDQFRFWARGLFKQQRAAEVVGLPRLDDAREAMSQFGIDVALLELGRDDTALMELLRWLREAKASPNPSMPVLLLVKDTGGPALRDACAFGIHGVLKKPVTGELLLKAVASVCRNPKRVALQTPAASTALPQPTLAHEPPSLTRRPGDLADPPPAKPMPLRRLSSSIPPPEGVGARPLSSAGGAVVVGKTASDAGIETAAMLKKASGTYGDDEPVEAVPEKPKEFLETPEPKAKVEDDGWGDADQPKPKKNKAEDEAFEPPEPLPHDGEPVAGRDLDAILAEHALWVQTGGTQGKRAQLEGEDLSGRTLAEAPLTNANLRRCDLSGSDLSKAELHGADLRHAELIGCQMVEANLAVARMRHAHLRGCTLDRANLQGADLAGADLAGSNFDGADLKGANMLGVSLNGADLSGAKGMTQAQLESATGDAKTKLPLGLRLVLAA